MGLSAIITIVVLVGAFILFITEIVSIDLVALLIMSSLVFTGVLSPEEGIAGFSDKATITVMFMFVLSEALLKTGALQYAAYYTSTIFKKNYRLGMFWMMLLIAAISAFINNTPIVAIFIPVVIQIAYAIGRNPTQMLIPLSFAAILGGTCTLIGTSPNIMVSGIAQRNGLPGFSMFELTPMGLITLFVGLAYMVVIGFNLLPDRRKGESRTAAENEQQEEEANVQNSYVTEIEIVNGDENLGKRIYDSQMIRELGMQVVEVQRKGSRIENDIETLTLEPNDILKVRTDIDKLKSLKQRLKLRSDNSILIGGHALHERDTTLAELVVTTDSNMQGKNLKELQFRNRYQATPMAIRHRSEMLTDHLYEVSLKSGDVVLAEVKNEFLPTLKRIQQEPNAPFVLLSLDTLVDFNRRQFMIVSVVTLLMIILASINVVPILEGSIAGVIVLVLAKCLTMKDMYRAINWKIIFLMAGALSLGVAMHNSKLDVQFAEKMVGLLGGYGPWVLLSGIYLITAIVTEMMSNHATAAFIAPIAIALAQSMGVSPTPFLMAVTFAASASFMTPIGYHTNTMVYSAGDYTFMDFVRVGGWLNLILWIVASICIPLLYPF